MKTIKQQKTYREIIEGLRIAGITEVKLQGAEYKMTLDAWEEGLATYGILDDEVAECKFTAFFESKVPQLKSSEFEQIKLGDKVRLSDIFKKDRMLPKHGWGMMYGCVNEVGTVVSKEEKSDGREHLSIIYVDFPSHEYFQADADELVVVG